ncbi:sarcosine oxidase subunit delta [uncultured Cohaesibacter sp.]|uniref:sarcosine oxidase subunit delta n=1 Tax=uncultured Cohaesibacter sp. TaxID=1002546 RepID=UPI0029C680BD|nr:sarcosine oxidase subunit delta [uncultured Cohaesibacter sp.]
MFKIDCPYCGARDESEFSYGGEAHITRPEKPESLSDEAWGAFLFTRSNKKGLIRERWLHSHGCRRWFNLLRDSASHEIIASYHAGEQPSITDLKKMARGGKEK